MNANGKVASLLLSTAFLMQCTHLKRDSILDTLGMDMIMENRIQIELKT